MERVIPSEKNMLLFPLLGKDKFTEDLYREKIENFETACERSFIDTLGRVGIKGLVKTKRKSLPYNHSYKISLQGESYLNGAFEFYRACRYFLKEILNNQQVGYKLRFFIHIEVVDKPFIFMGSIEYTLCYHV